MAREVKKNITEGEQKGNKDWPVRGGKKMKKMLVDLSARLVKSNKHHRVGGKEVLPCCVM